MSRATSVLASGLLASLALACSAMGDYDEPSSTESGDESAAAEFDFAPEQGAEESEVDDEAIKADMMAAADAGGSLYAKDGQTGEDVRLGYTFNAAVTIAPGQTVEFTTSDGIVEPGYSHDKVDTVLVLYRRHDNSSTWVTSPWTLKYGVQTLIADDDGAGNALSHLTYTNQTGQTENAWLMGFAYRFNDDPRTCKSGSAVVSGTVNFGRVSFTSCGMPYVTSNRGEAYVTGGTDPALFVFDFYSGGNGGWNEDDPLGTLGYNPRFQGLTNLPTWIVPVGIFQGPGTVRIYF